MDEYEIVTDQFRGVSLVGRQQSRVAGEVGTSTIPRRTCGFYWLTFHTQHRGSITEAYLEHVVKEGKEIRVRNRQRKLYTKSPWLKMAELQADVVEPHRVRTSGNVRDNGIGATEEAGDHRRSSDP
ncbi:hypothetical protein SLE2022_375920 [Rubroshorea leprosula]